MTTDKLVQFAASKVGGEVCDPTGDHKAVKIAYGDEYSGWTTYRLSSPDLMLKGMEVYPYRVGIQKFSKEDGGTIELAAMDLERKPLPIAYNEIVDKVADIPLTFWKCWYKLEKRE